MKKPSTDIAQSNQLVKLGLDPKTADFVWEWEVDAIYLKYHYNDKNGRRRVPAWSVDAMLKAMPVEIGEFRLQLVPHDGSWICRYEFNAVHQTYQKAGVGDTPVDAVYEMLCWLLENGVVKSVKTNCPKCGKRNNVSDIEKGICWYCGYIKD